MISDSQSVEGPEGSQPERDDLDRAAQSIIRYDKRWQPGERLDLRGLGWRPHLARAGPDAVMHIHIAERLRPYLVDRLKAAAGSGYEVHVAVPLAGLYDEELLRDLAPLDVQIHVLGSPRGVASNSLLTALADHGIVVTAKTRESLATAVVDLSRNSPSKHVRGRSFESVLLFLLGQTDGFRVVEHNYRTDTEELDGVIQQVATGGRVWATLGAPFILLEAKNWLTQRVDQPVVSVLRVKMEGRRGTVRIGLLVGASGFTSAALEQEVRFASGNLTIVCVGPDDLDNWIASTTPDDYLERLISHAMLR